LRRFSLFLVVVALIGIAVVVLLHLTSGIGTPIGLGWLLWLVGGSLLVGTLTTQINGILNIIGFRGWYVVLANATSWAGLGLSIGLTLWQGRTAEFWLSGVLLGQLLVLAGSIGVLRRVGRVPRGVAMRTYQAAGFDVRSVFRFSWPLIISTGFYWAQTNGYRFVLAALADTRMIGLLTVGLTIATAPLAMFDTLFTEFYRPIFYHNIKFGSASQKALAWNRYASAYFPAIILMGSLIACSGPYLARVLVSDAFQGVAWLAPWGALLQSTLMVYGTYVALSFASLDTRVLIRPNILGAAVALILTAMLARRQPLDGTAIALTLGMGVTMVGTALRLGREFPHKLPWRRLGLAVLLGLPLVLVLWGLRGVRSEPTQIQSALVLAGSGGYVLLAQLLLAREWLFGEGRDEDDTAATASAEGVS
jgi:O-antigen/teichoic acid export membrane protein